MTASIYDTPIFFERYQQLRQNPISLNEVVEKPTMFGLMPDLTGKWLLDLGCGTGEHLLHYLQQGADFVMGVDLSEAMIRAAEQRLSAQFSAQRFKLYSYSMTALNSLTAQQFDVVTSSFAFHYVADFADLLAQIKAKLKPHGELIFSQEHPIVTCHKSGERWEKDQQKQQQAYRLNHYREEGLRERNWFQQPFKTYHRTLSTILNQLIQAGFEIAHIAEPMLAEQVQWHAEFKDLLHRPPLLFVKARLKAETVEN